MGGQFSFEYNSEGLRCMVHREDSVSKTNRGGLHDMMKERKIVWVKLNSEGRCCPIRIIEKYMSLLPLHRVKFNFYLQSLHKTKPNVWYSTILIGINALLKVVGTLLRDAGLDGYFTNHSLRGTCATYLFQAEECSKTVKEVMGHVSDAINKYQETSNAQ